MTKLGVITDGISRNPERAFAVMNEFGLEYAELQYIDDLEVGDLNDAQTARVQDSAAGAWTEGALHLASHLRRPGTGRT